MNTKSTICCFWHLWPWGVKLNLKLRKYPITFGIEPHWNVNRCWIPLTPLYSFDVPVASEFRLEWIYICMQGRIQDFFTGGGRRGEILGQPRFFFKYEAQDRVFLGWFEKKVFVLLKCSGVGFFYIPSLNRSGGGHAPRTASESGKIGPH